VLTKVPLRVTSSPSLKMKIDNGDSLTIFGKVDAVTLRIQVLFFSTDFYLISLGGCDVVLRVEWLCTLGPILWDFFLMTMRFTLRNTPTLLTSLPTASFYLEDGANFLKASLLSNKCFLLKLILVTLAAQPGPHPGSIQALLHSFKDIFANPVGLPPSRAHDHHILLKSSQPINVRSYRYPYFQKAEIEKLIREMLHSGVIRQSHSPFSTPILLVRKADGSWRFCVDYRAINHETIKDKFSKLVIDELLDELHGVAISSKLDLRSSYHQIRMQPSDIPKTAFRTHEGHYEFLVMAFGLTNAPSTFQALMNDVFRPFLRCFVLVFFDNILIYSRTLEDHVIHLQQVLEVLVQHQLFAKLSKCHFAMAEIEYLVHLISAQGV
jgi:hypothetical protein